MWIFQLFVLENLQLLIVNGYIASGLQGIVVMLLTFLCCLGRKCEIGKASRGYNDLERDNKSSQLIEENQYLFICYKLTVFMQVLPNFM